MEKFNIHKGSNIKLCVVFGLRSKVYRNLFASQKLMALMLMIEDAETSNL